VLNITIQRKESSLSYNICKCMDCPCTAYRLKKNQHISDQSTRMKTTRVNRGNKTSHAYRPIKYITRAAAPAKKKHTHMHSSNTQHTGSDHTKNKFHKTKNKIEQIYGHGSQRGPMLVAGSKLLLLRRQWRRGRIPPLSP
jgi:hypothetical protein